MCSLIWQMRRLAELWEENFTLGSLWILVLVYRPLLARHGSMCSAPNDRTSPMFFPPV